jgi:prepilin-type N-terminal cleavage/methylation domain-containing protein
MLIPCAIGFRLPTSSSGEGLSRRGWPRKGAFTLIELLLVMALLVIVLGVTFPSLQNFFRGRTLNSETRRFLALTRYAQSRAVSEGIPTVLWLDARQGTYGLQAEAGYLDTDTKAVEFTLEESVRFEVSLPPVVALMTQRNRAALKTANLPAIRFGPDGSIGETSPESVRFEETRAGPASAIWVAQAATRNGYEIRQDEPRTTYGRP